MLVGTRSRVDEANPVVGGRADIETANIVFQGWRTDPKIQTRFNPIVELLQARAIRDRILHRFLLKPGHVTGYPTKELAIAAQFQIIQALATERRWGRAMIDRYFGIEMPDEVWAGVFARAVA